MSVVRIMVTCGPVSGCLLHQKVVEQPELQLAASSGRLAADLIPVDRTLGFCSGDLLDLLPCRCLTQGTITQQGCRFETSKFFRQMAF